METYIIEFQIKKWGLLKYTTEVKAKNFNEAVKYANTLKRIKFKNEFYIKSIKQK